MKLFQIFLLPFSLCYGLFMMIRNYFFDWNIFRSESFDTLVITIGNLSLGGTGKTPHIEYLVRLLKEKYKLGILSRGYGRKSEGFVLGSKRSNVKYIGDEPLQFIRKFDDIKVAVDENRKRGIQHLLTKFPQLEIILLDDAFQHRWVKPAISILLTDYLHLYPDDYVLPSGRLREFRFGASRADIIIVTKTPKIFSPITKRRILEDLKPKNHQKVFFSYIKYGDLVPLFDNMSADTPSKVSFILVFSGIADDFSLKEYLERKCSNLISIHFRDHHDYTLKDMEMIKKRYDDLPTNKKVIITTEKDVMRLKTPELNPFLKTMPIYYLPMEIDFHGQDKQTFDNYILDYAEQNKRNH